jgi:uncharacterized protein
LSAPSLPASPYSDADLERLQDLLDALPPPLQPLDISALDGFLCGTLLQPQRVPAERWLPLVCDIEGRAAPASATLDELQTLLRRRHAELDRAIGQREWFDPWIYQLDGDAPATECVLPWVAGFAAAMEAFPALMAQADTALVEPLALIFMHFDPEDLEDAEALQEVIETLEPPSDLAEAVQDIVRALMLMADVTRPRITPTAPRRPTPRTRPMRRGQRQG